MEHIFSTWLSTYAKQIIENLVLPISKKRTEKVFEWH